MSTQNKPTDSQPKQVDWNTIKDDDEGEEHSPETNENQTEDKSADNAAGAQQIQHRNIDGHHGKHQNISYNGGKQDYNAAQAYKGPIKHNPNQTDNAVSNLEQVEKLKERTKPLETAKNLFECDAFEDDEEVKEEEVEEKPEKSDKNFLKDLLKISSEPQVEKQQEQKLSKKEQKQLEMEQFERTLQQMGIQPTQAPATEAQADEQKEQGGAVAADKKKKKKKEKKEGEKDAPAEATEKQVQEKQETTTEKQTTATAPVTEIDREAALKLALAKRAQNSDKNKQNPDIEAAKAEILKRSDKSKKNQKQDFDL